ncbi:MAG: pyrroline-5-carboxylate reductase [Xanthobacteraceae bacterium]|nr:pyrroline-5-carboxylate reductase [Xanthobacteraceae bacterium]
MTMASSNTSQTSLGALTGNLVLVGAGKMGGAMLAGWLAGGLDPRRAVVIEPMPSDELTALAARGVQVNPLSSGVAAVPAAAIVIAVKPQGAADAMASLASMVGPQTVAVSIMAGRPLAFLEQHLPAGTAAVRAMPNTPAAIGRGMTVAVPNARVSAAQRDLAHQLLAATGAVEWVADEALMDAVTAVSGSGPAYVFLLAEALAKAGVAAGLPPELAARLARETVAGSGELLHTSPLDAAVLRQNVTSPGGTTAAALSVLMAEPGLQALLDRAIDAATKRSRELAG